MVEGHQCHRVAHAHRRLLIGKAFKATSPNGRFKEGAAAINEQVLHRIEVHGKNLFYFFGRAAEPVVMHVHFGMSGAFRTMALPGAEPKETTRLQLLHSAANLVAHLSAMTVQHGGLDLYEEKSSKLGPDPLREDADKELLWAKMQGSKKSVGLVLMDQTMVAGIGNIYRAEILYKSGLHPEQPARTLSRSQFETVWAHSVSLLQRGFLTGSILTVDPEDAKALGKPWTRRYIYNHKTCGRCQSPVKSWDMASRTCYACEVCQPLTGGAAELLQPDRLKALGAATGVRLFKSHCAPDDEAEAPPAKMTCDELRTRLRALKLDPMGNKAVLVQRLEEALASARSANAAGASASQTESESQVDLTAALPALATPAKTSTGRKGARSQAAAAGSDAASKPPPRRGALATQPPALTASSEGKLAAEAAVAAAVVAPVARPVQELQQLQPGTPASSADAVDRAEELLTRSMQTPQAGTHGAVAADASGSNGAPALAQLTVAQLKQRLRQVGSTVSGSKAQLVTRLLAAQQAAAAHVDQAVAAADDALVSSAPGVEIRPGTAFLGEMASAKDAALEKLRAGENRAVEHVALADDDTQHLISKQHQQNQQQQVPITPPAATRKRRVIVSSMLESSPPKRAATAQ